MRYYITVEARNVEVRVVTAAEVAKESTKPSLIDKLDGQQEKDECLPKTQLDLPLTRGTEKASSPKILRLTEAVRESNIEKKIKEELLKTLTRIYGELVAP